MENKSIIAKEAVFDRIEQSFELFKKNFIELFLPIFLYTFWTITIFTSIFSYFWLKYLQEFSKNFNESKIAENMDWLNYSSEIIIWVSVFIILIILFVAIYIPFWLGTVKWIKQAYNWEKVTTKENIIYWFKNIFNSFKTYWFSFAYVALIPALIWIIWWLLFIYWNFNNNSSFEQVWWSISMFAIILFIFFAIYRWIKSSFYISSAIDKNEFTKENFYFWINITKDKWWRILWNFILVWLIVSLVTWVLNTIIWLVGSSFDIDTNSLLNLKENWNPEELMNIVNTTLDSYSPVLNFIKSTLENVVSTISTIFILIFTYIFFKRLEVENNDLNGDIEESKKIEL